MGGSFVILAAIFALFFHFPLDFLGCLLFVQQLLMNDRYLSLSGKSLDRIALVHVVLKCNELYQSNVLSVFEYVISVLCCCGCCGCCWYGISCSCPKRQVIY